MTLASASAIASSICQKENCSSSGPLLPVDTSYSLSFKSKVLKQLHLGFYLSGISSLYGWIRTQIKQESVAVILMYHSVPEAVTGRWIDPSNSLSPEVFEQHMRFLSQHRHVVSIDRLVQQLEQGEPIRQGTVAITFDDGYLDNLTVAAPILAKYHLPATIYLATDYMATGENQWIDILYSAFRTRTRHCLSLPEIGSWQLTNRAEIKAAYQQVAAYLIPKTYRERQRLLVSIKAQLAPTAHPPRLTMTWADIQQLQQQYPHITLGIHTASHLDLSAHPEATGEEITRSMTQMVAATGDRPNHLAFPYNRYCAQAQARVATYLKSAVAVAADPVVRNNTSRYALPRLEAPKSTTMLKSWTNGGFPHLSQRLLGRSWMRPD